MFCYVKGEIILFFLAIIISKQILLRKILINYYEDKKKYLRVCTYLFEKFYYTKIN